MDAPAVISFAATGYEHVSGLAAMRAVTKARDYFNGSETTAGLSDSLARLVQVRNQINWVQELYKFYGGYSDQQMEAIAQEIARDLSTIGTQIEAYENDPTQAFTAPGLASLKHGSPHLQVKFDVSPVWGGGGGERWDDIPQPLAYIERKTRIASVQLHAGRFVDKS